MIWRDWPAVLMALAGAATLIYWWRVARPLWVDEEMLGLNLRWRSFSELGGALWLDQSAPLGWLALERTALLLFGVDERGARALTVVWGLGTLATAVWVGHRWMGRPAAAVLAALCSVGPWIVFFTLELKHYSADACGALLLPGLAAWAAEPVEGGRPARRIGTFWGVAAIGGWLSNGVTFVAPVCAVVLVGCHWRRGGLRSALRAALPGVVWLASLGLNYVLVLRHALGNAYLENYWSFAFPPQSAGLAGTIAWTAHVMQTFPIKPVGTGWPVLFWCVVLVGFGHALIRHPPLGLSYASVPVAALALGLLGIVPPFERLGLWSVPALYVGVALGVDAGVRLATERHRLSPLVALAAPAVLVASALVVLDIVGNGIAELGAKPVDSNYGLDDRKAVRRVEDLRQPDDVVFTTHFGLAGLWWYGGVDISNADAGAWLGDSQVFEMGYATDRPSCEAAQSALDQLATHARRVIVYLGFRMNVLPDGFNRFVLGELGRRGALVAYSQYADLSQVAAFDLTQPASPAAAAWLRDKTIAAGPPLAGCLTVHPARRW